MALGERDTAGGPFVVFALAARSGLPVLAALGGVLGGVAVILPHLLSETPLNRLRGFDLTTVWLNDPDGVTNYYAQVGPGSRTARGQN